jgi:hypothetical protein
MKLLLYKNGSDFKTMQNIIQTSFLVYLQIKNIPEFNVGLAINSFILNNDTYLENF